MRRYNADLANDFGNLLNRTLNMTSRFLSGTLPALAGGDAAADADVELRAAAAEAVTAYRAAMERKHLDEALMTLMGLVRAGNGYAESQAPWALSKAGETERLAMVLASMAETCRILGHLVAPFTPATARALHEQLGVPAPYDERGAGGPGLAQLAAWGAIGAGWQVADAKPLFPRVELPAGGRCQSPSPPGAAGWPGRLALPPPGSRLRARGWSGRWSSPGPPPRASSVCSSLATISLLPSSHAAVELARRHRAIRAAVGVHPHYAAATTDAEWKVLASLAAEPEVVAIRGDALGRPPKPIAAGRSTRCEASWPPALASTIPQAVLVHESGRARRHADRVLLRLARRTRSGCDLDPWRARPLRRCGTGRRARRGWIPHLVRLPVTFGSAVAARQPRRPCPAAAF